MKGAELTNNDDVLTEADTTLTAFNLPPFVTRAQT
jgi:hypothetical protein